MEDLYIRLASDERDIAAVVHLWSDYRASLLFPLEFEGFEDEVRKLPGQYGPPRGLLLLASVMGEAAGTVALRPLSGTACEVKRLYVRTKYRGRGLGRALLDQLFQRARSLGYEELYGDTLPTMIEARRLYERLGFQEVGPYSDSPTPGAIYLKLPLVGSQNSRNTG